MFIIVILSSRNTKPCISVHKVFLPNVSANFDAQIHRKGTKMHRSWNITVIIAWRRWIWPRWWWIETQWIRWKRLRPFWMEVLTLQEQSWQVFTNLIRFKAQAQFNYESWYESKMRHSALHKLKPSPPTQTRYASAYKWVFEVESD